MYRLICCYIHTQGGGVRGQSWHTGLVLVYWLSFLIRLKAQMFPHRSWRLRPLNKVHSDLFFLTANFLRPGCIIIYNSLWHLSNNQNRTVPIIQGDVFCSCFSSVIDNEFGLCSGSTQEPPNSDYSKTNVCNSTTCCARRCDLGVILTHIYTLNGPQVAASQSQGHYNQQRDPSHESKTAFLMGLYGLVTHICNVQRKQRGLQIIACGLSHWIAIGKSPS